MSPGARNVPLGARGLGAGSTRASSNSWTSSGWHTWNMRVGVSKSLSRNLPRSSRVVEGGSASATAAAVAWDTRI